jgi:hypothetical protein
MSTGDASPSECDALSQASEVHRSQRGYDALYVFLRVHHCICARIERDDDFRALGNLNDMFASRCNKVYASVLAGRFSPDDLSDKWVLALEAYWRWAHSYLRVLPLMARAHILDDLPACLYPTEIRKESYDSIFEVIIGCLRNVLKDVLKNNKEDTITNAIKCIEAALVDNPGAHSALYVLREMAWRKVEWRRALAQKFRTGPSRAD